MRLGLGSGNEAGIWDLGMRLGLGSGNEAGTGIWE